MSEDPLAHHPKLRRPGAVIGWISALYLVATVPIAVVNLDQNWRHPLEGLTGWMILWLVLTVPITVVVSVLAARMDRALSGVRHTGRAAWAGVALGTLLSAHFASHLPWSPIYLFWALTSSYRTEDNLLGAVSGLVAWGFVAGGIWLARRSARTLRERSWEDQSADERKRLFPRIPTPWLGAIAYGMTLLPVSVFVAAFAIDDRTPVLSAFAWGFAGLVLAGLGGAWGSWLYEGVPHGREPTRPGPRFAELFGTTWCAHWLPFFAMAILPFWGDWHHEDQLAASVLAAFAVVVGVAGWSYGRAARWVAAE